MQITLKELNKTIDYQIERTNRRSGTLRIAVKSGQLIVYAPRDCPLSIIEDTLQAKASWIWERLESSRQKIAETKKKDTLLWRGKSYPVKIRINKQPRVTFLDDTFLIDTPNKDPKIVEMILEYWFKNQAEQLVPTRVFELAKQVGAYPRKVSFRNQKTRWGSCSTNGNISLNIRLLMAPTQILDYVIIHELCHLLDHSHSEGYWQLVSKHYPAYKEARAWLKSNYYALAF